MADQFDEIMIDLPNIRCVTCGKVLGHLHDKLGMLRAKNYTNEEIFEDLGLTRPCCRVSMIHPPKYSMVGIIDEEQPTFTLSDDRIVDKSTSLKSRLMKIKEKEATETKKKPVMCYYAI